MKQLFLGLLKRDFWLKVLALALAVLLWAMVMRDYNKETSVTFDVALAVRQHPVFDMFEGRQDLETSVLVQVTGPSLLVGSLREDEIEAWVDYSQVTQAGRAVDVDVQVSGPERIRGQVKYRVTPPTVSVTLVENRSVTIPVVLSSESGIVRSGDREFYYTVSLEERAINLSGRDDYLKYVRRGLVTLEELDLQPPLVGGTLQPTVVLSKPVLPVDATDKPVEKLEQRYANVTLTWEELPPGKSVRVQPQTIGALPPGFELVGLSVEPEVVTARLAGPDGQLPELSVVLAEPVDLTGQTTTFTTTARLTVPQGTSLSATSVNVRVTIAETEMEKVFGAVPLAVRNQPAEVDISLPTPTVQVRFTGPYTLMTQLDAGSITVYVDLADLKEGRHRVPVKVPNPPGITEVAVDPAVVDVIITNR